MEIQLEFFKSKEQCEIEELIRQFDLLKTSSDKVRKGVFARHNEILKNVKELSDRLEIIERNICKAEDRNFIAI